MSLTPLFGSPSPNSPHTFVARTALEELLASPGAGAKAQPLLPRLVAPLRAALASPSDACVLAALAALGQLARACGPALAPAVVRDVAVPVGRALERHPKPAVRDAARAALQAVDDCCGPAGAAALRAKLPTWGQR